MQGAHEDHLFKCLHNPDSPSRQATKAELKAKITKEVTIPKFELIDEKTPRTRLDKGLNWLRNTSARCCAWVISLSCGYTSIDRFREHKVARVNEGRKTILDLQLIRKNWYGSFLDVYCQWASFGAEEEFYLIVLPFIFWNIDWLFAHHLLCVVNIGLYFGNLLKDVFCLPRPSGVWRPRHLLESDSAGLQDYGFPSTHTMNGISNSLFYVLFYFGGYYHTGPPPMPFWAASMLGVLWASSLTFSRCDPTPHKLPPHRPQFC